MHDGVLVGSVDGMLSVPTVTDTACAAITDAGSKTSDRLPLIPLVPAVTAALPSD
jgi:hypothetical protein